MVNVLKMYTELKIEDSNVIKIQGSRYLLLFFEIIICMRQYFLT